jgi:hypothetical protein
MVGPLAEGLPPALTYRGVRDTRIELGEIEDMQFDFGTAELVG